MSAFCCDSFGDDMIQLRENGRRWVFMCSRIGVSCITFKSVLILWTLNFLVFPHSTVVWCETCESFGCFRSASTLGPETLSMGNTFTLPTATQITDENGALDIIDVFPFAICHCFAGLLLVGVCRFQALFPGCELPVSVSLCSVIWR